MKAVRRPPGAVKLIFNPSADDIDEVSRLAAIVP